MITTLFLGSLNSLNNVGESSDLFNLLLKTNSRAGNKFILKKDLKLIILQSTLQGASLFLLS